MHWSDIQSLYKPGCFLCFADTVDDLVEAGWTAVQDIGKRSASEAGLKDCSYPYVTQNPAEI